MRLMSGMYISLLERDEADGRRKGEAGESLADQAEVSM